MKPYFECTDKLNKPYEAFLFDAQTSDMFPILPHWHYFVEILYMVEGYAYVEAGKENYVLEPGDLILFYPQMTHSIYSTGQLPIRYYVLKFDPAHLNISGSALPPISNLIAMAAEEKKLSSYFSKEKLDQRKIKLLIQESIKTLEEKQFGYDIILHSNFCLLLAEILHIWEQEGLHIKKRKKETALKEKFAEVSEYISQHYQEDLSVTELADKLHMSYSYFASKFKEYYGQTCKEMILAVRLQKAGDLLQFTDFDLTYISQETGFCDCSHFIKAFKQMYGMTPRKYRMNVLSSAANQSTTYCILPLDSGL